MKANVFKGGIKSNSRKRPTAHNPLPQIVAIPTVPLLDARNQFSGLRGIRKFVSGHRFSDAAEV
jgi:hypothetical protein